MDTKCFVIELQQGTHQWLVWRHNGIGSSEASTIMGENRFESALMLLQQKRGPVIFDSPQNEAMAIGTKLEPEARRLYISETGKVVRPVCVQSSKYDWLRASLDGLSTNHDAVVEIKCGAGVYRRVSRSRSVPDYYYGQVQHILAVTGLQSLDFWCYWPDNPALLVPVERNDAYIERLLAKELEFWNLVSQTSTPRRTIIISLVDTGNPDEDNYKFRSVIRLLREFPGQDSVQLEVAGDGRRTLLELPLVTTSFCLELEERLAYLVGYGQVKTL